MTAASSRSPGCSTPPLTITRGANPASNTATAASSRARSRAEGVLSTPTSFLSTTAKSLATGRAINPAPANPPTYPKAAAPTSQATHPNTLTENAARKPA